MLLNIAFGFEIASYKISSKIQLFEGDFVLFDDIVEIRKKVFSSVGYVGRLP